MKLDVRDILYLRGDADALPLNGPAYIAYIQLIGISARGCAIAAPSPALIYKAMIACSVDAYLKSDKPIGILRAACFRCVG